jgi:hypothetical protein
MSQFEVLIEDTTDPAEADRNRQGREQFQRNAQWLQAHWQDLLPRARGKYVAVAGQEAFVAATPAEAWAWAKNQHPEDKGPLVQYVLASQGPRSYVNRRIVAHVR